MRAVTIVVVVLLCHQTKIASGFLIPPQAIGRGIENELQKLKPGLKLAVMRDEDIKQADSPGASWLRDLLKRRLVALFRL